MSLVATAAYIVDAHHHLWSLREVSYPWLEQRGVRRFFGDPTPIQHDYRASDFRGDHGSFEVRKSVHVQVGAGPGQEIEETRWLEAEAERGGFPSAIVAYCDLSSPDAGRLLERHAAASKRLRGLRQIISRHPDEDARDSSPALLSNPQVAENLRLLPELGLSFDLQLTPPHMIAAARLFEQVEGLQVALCHAGSPWRRDPDGLAEWRDGLKALAGVPGLTCKLSGLGMFDPQWTLESLRPVAAAVLEIFGPDRVMWGSNFPVDKLYRGYAELLGTLLEIVPQDMHDQVFRTAAERFYRI
jgi:predicted TIM-barrel fold metal-dependent hydrolase